MFTEKELTGHYLRTAMNSSEVRELLMGIKLVDNRRVSDGSVEMWRRILSDLELDECKLAVIEHFRTSTQYLEPQHIRHIVRKWRQERVLSNDKETIYDKGEPSAPPKNLREMTDFYRDLAAKIQWGPHEDPDKVARKLGMNPPTPLWDDEA